MYTMSIVCQTLEDYYKSYDGGLYNDLVNDITVNKLLDYFSYIEEVQKKCNNEIKKSVKFHNETDLIFIRIKS